ncbi:MAG: GAF domain-containing protein, partial [Anaerolineaceae bacterium]|nr:GAF domain-containing protein [Anaerolineaceae bacterium]
MNKRWRLLLIEDQEDDAALVLAELRRAGFDFNWKRVYIREEIQNALQTEKWDLIISDYALPGFNGLAALNLCQKLGVDSPFIIVSGTIGEDTAVDMLKSGASDYLLKGNLARLSASVQKALRDAAIRQEQKRAEKLERVLFHISQAANMATDLEEFFATIHESLKQVMNAENFYIALYDPKRNIISFPYFVDQFDPIPLPKHPGRGMTEYVLRTGKPSLVTPEVFAELEAAGEVETSGSPSLDWVGVPLKAGEQTLGVMVVQTYDEGIRYEKRDVDVLDFISDQVEMVIHRKLAEESLRESEHKFSLFMDHLPLQSTISNDSGRLIYANNETLRMIGDRDAAGKLYADLFPPELAKMLQEYDHKALQDGL